MEQLTNKFSLEFLRSGRKFDLVELYSKAHMRNEVNKYLKEIACDMNEISNYLYCEETKDYFSIFSEEETLDEITKRFIFINQFRLIKMKFLIVKNNNFYYIYFFRYIKY